MSALNPLLRYVLVPVQREFSILGPILRSSFLDLGPIEPGTALAPSRLLMHTYKPVLPPPTHSTGESGSLEGRWIYSICRDSFLDKINKLMMQNRRQEGVRKTSAKINTIKMRN